MKTTNIPLPKPLRSQLEVTVKAARDVAERGAKAALLQLAVGEGKVPDYLVSDDLKSLRRRLRAHGRALGDAKAKDDTQGVQHLVWEVAYEQWHRMLFARFLAENGMLIWEPGAPVSLDDCREMVDNHPDMAMGAKSHWELAGKLAARMLPQVFKPQSPVFELTFAPEHQRELERLLAALPSEVFKASDSLGWVYQFWQAKRKDEVNASEVKIGADELPAVTQLFTEPYMVDFLLHNSLGAWWVTRHPGKTCPVPLTYLRTLEDGTPAAGKFEGWPNSLSEFKLLDPCCGSGHFLVAAFLMLVPMRMEAEGLSAMDAVDAVLADNLHGLEIDARCVEIAVFALALAAWRFPDEDGDSLGVRTDMPLPQIACCGLKVAAKPQDWVALVPDHVPNAEHLREGLRRLHRDFSQAPLLGSLLDPSKASGDLFAADFSLLAELLEAGLRAEHQPELWDDGIATWDNALTARGLLDAAKLLEGRYHLVVTNVPYLARGKQNETLKDYCEAHYPEAKNDLANVFLERCLELAREPAGGTGVGVVQIVMPQNWLFLNAYIDERNTLLSTVSFKLIGLLGVRGFSTPMWDFNVQLLTLDCSSPISRAVFSGIDASTATGPSDKSEALRISSISRLNQAAQRKNPESRILLDERGDAKPLSVLADSTEGLSTGDGDRFMFCAWELPLAELGVADWEPLQEAPSGHSLYGGLVHVVRWERGQGALSSFKQARIQGQLGWGRRGILVSEMGSLWSCLHLGYKHYKTVGVVVPSNSKTIPALWAFCSSEEYARSVRQIDKSLKVAPKSLVKVPFNAEHWQQVAAEAYPEGLPKPYSDDATQWLFHGHPQPATDALQVAVARLAGYRWPAETDTAMDLADEARTWIAHCGKLAEHTDDDGILCLPSVRGEPPAHDRLLKLLIAAWETVQPGSWKPAVLDKLLADADCAGKGLDVWLRDKFFEQHAKLFHHRPFIWHMWDGLKDGFAALVNYHKLDDKNLERLIHTYLGRWISDQEDGVRNNVDGAPTRLAAAQDLKRRLELILEGDKPYDIFVRWKKLAEQPIGWNPDLNDGVRLNIRPFMTADVLRHNKKPKLNITWDKDRGKDVESAPWFKTFKGERINDHHLTLAEKRAAREKA